MPTPEQVRIAERLAAGQRRMAKLGDQRFDHTRAVIRYGGRSYQAQAVLRKLGL